MAVEFLVTTDGELMSWIGYPGQKMRDEIRTVSRVAFRGTIQITDMRRGRSAAHFVATIVKAEEVPDATPLKKGTEVDVFMTDALEMMRAGVAAGGIVSGDFEACKRGQNYGLRLLKDRS